MGFGHRVYIRGDSKSLGVTEITEKDKSTFKMNDRYWDNQIQELEGFDGIV